MKRVYFLIWKFFFLAEPPNSKNRDTNKKLHVKLDRKNFYPPSINFIAWYFIGIMFISGTAIVVGLFHMGYTYFFKDRKEINNANDEKEEAKANPEKEPLKVESPEQPKEKGDQKVNKEEATMKALQEMLKNKTNKESQKKKERKGDLYTNSNCEFHPKVENNLNKIRRVNPVHT